MTLSELASLAEITGLILVIASLIYLARQIRQSTAMMQVSVSSERLQRETDIVNDIVRSREVAEYWAKGAAEFESLDEVDKQRMIFFERRALLHWHSMYGLRQQNLVSDADWHELKWVIRNIGFRQSIRASWAAFREGYEDSFQNFIDQQFLLADEETANKDL